MEPDLTEPAPEAPPSRRRRVIVGGIAVLVAAAMLATAWPAARGPSPRPPAVAADPDTVTIVAGAPASIDPAKHGDLGSASYVSQLYETLTAVDPTLVIRPALAESWIVADDGRQVTFTLRPDLEFSDGSPLARRGRRAQLAPPVRARRAVAARLADRRRQGRPGAARRAPAPTRARSACARRATGPSSSTSSAAAATCRPSCPARRSPSCRASVGDGEIIPDRRAASSGSGGYTLERGRPGRLRAQGQPAVLGRQAGDRDRAHGHDARGREPGGRVRGGRRGRRPDRLLRRRLDRLRPRARAVAAQRPVAVGDVLRLRHASSRRSTTCASARRSPRPWTGGASRRSTSRARPSRPRAWSRPGSPARPRATSCRRTTRRARRRSSPRRATPTARASGRSRSSPTAAATTARSSRCSRRTWASTSSTRRWSSGPTRTGWRRTRRDLWSISWVADYPGPNDFLGVLLGTGSTANQGGWSSAPFDDAIAEATAAGDAGGRDRRLRPRPRDRARRGAGRARSRTGPRSRSCATGCWARPDRDRHPPARRPRVGGGAVSATAGAARPARGCSRRALLAAAALLPAVARRRAPRTSPSARPRPRSRTTRASPSPCR